MTKIESMNSIKEKRLKIAEILDTIAIDKRELTNVEKITIESLNDEIKQIETNSKRMSEIPEVQLVIDNNNSEKFSLTKYFRNIKDGQLSDFEKEINKKAKENSEIGMRGYALPLTFEKRTLAAGSTGYGEELVSEDKFSLLEPLRAKSVLSKAGATFLTSLKANISIPVMTGNNAYWKSEVATSGDGGASFTEVEFSPKRLTVCLPVSNLLLYQNSVDTEAKLKNDLIKAINAKLESTIFGVASGDTTQPAGIFYNATLTASGATDWTKIVSLETNINSNNADVDSMFYIVRPELLGKLKTTSKASNTATYIAENGTINGYKFITTTHLATSGSSYYTAFGNFSDVYVCMWNNLEIIEDKLTGAKEGITNYIINLYVDAGLTRSASVSKALLS